jgi:hypothetical protein
MIRKETAEPVVQYLRALTYDGELSADEVWNLANWLNQQPDQILETWPAKPLVAALQSAFSDNVLTSVELEELAGTILAIEELWTETYPLTPHEAASEQIAASKSLVEETKPTLPSIPLSAEIPDPSRADTFTVDLQHHTCTCPDWTENREGFPEGDYRRCCRHLVRAFRSVAAAEESLHRDPLFLAFIEEHDRNYKGAEPDTMWHVVVINGARVLYGASPASEWVHVFAPNGDTTADGTATYKRYGYNRKKKRWAYGQGPQNISWHITTLFSQTQPHLTTAPTVTQPIAAIA